MLPLGSPEFPRQPTRGRVIGVGTSGCTDSMAGLTGTGVRMGAADMTGMEDRPTDRFGMEPIPGGEEGEEEEAGEETNRWDADRLLKPGAKECLVFCVFHFLEKLGFFIKFKILKIIFRFWV